MSALIYSIYQGEKTSLFNAVNFIILYKSLFIIEAHSLRCCILRMVISLAGYGIVFS